MQAPLESQVTARFGVLRNFFRLAQFAYLDNALRAWTVSISIEFAIRQSEKPAALGRLANSIAHEVNNPLEAVTNLLFLSQNTNDLSAIKEYLKDAHRELRRVAVITAQTVRFHKQSSGSAAVTYDELIDDAMSLYQGRVP